MSKFGKCKIDGCANDATGRDQRCDLHLYTMFAEVMKKVLP